MYADMARRQWHLQRYGVFAVIVPACNKRLAAVSTLLIDTQYQHQVIIQGVDI